MLKLIRKAINRIQNNKSGSVMITAMFMMLLLVTTVTGLATLSVSQTQIVDLQKKSSRALQIADAGLNHGMLIIHEDSALLAELLSEDGVSENYGGGTYTVTAEEIFEDWYKLTSEGVLVGEANRTIEQYVTISNFWNVAFSGDPVVNLQGNAKIIGSLFVKDDLVIDRGGAGIKRGPLYVKGNIELNNAAAYIGEEDYNVPLFIDGTYTGLGNYYVDPVFNWTPEISLPEIDMENLKAQAIANGTYFNQNVTLNGTSDFGADGTNFRYRIEKQTKGSWNLTEITPAGSDLATASFSGPKAVGTDADDNIYAADTGNNRIRMFDTTGTLKLEWGGTTTYDGQTLSNPSGIAVDSGTGTRYAYVSDSGRNRILKFEITKTVDDYGTAAYEVDYTGTSWTTGLSNPQKVALDSTERIYVASKGNNKVVRYDGASTQEITSFTVPSGRTPTFNAPEGIGVDDDGNILVADTGNERVIHFNTNFTYLDETRGGNAVRGPRSSFADNGFVYVSEVKSSPSTKKVTRIAYGDSGFEDNRSFSTNLNNPESVVVDSSGMVVVADTGNNKVKVFKEPDSGLYVSGITYIKGNLTIDDGIIYTLGSAGGTIVVEGNIVIEGRSGRKFFRPLDPVDDAVEANHRLVKSIGLITPNDISLSGSSGDSYTKPTFVALTYGKNKITFSGSFIFRGVFASESALFEQVPTAYIQRPENIPPGVPGGDEPQIYVGGWREID